MTLADLTEITTERLRELHRLSIRRYDSYAPLYADYLETGRRLLGMPTGMISRIEGKNYHVVAVTSPLDALRAGQIHPLSNLYCEQVVRERRAVAHHNIGLDPQVSLYPVYASTHLEAYLGAPLMVNGNVYGTLSFSDSLARTQPFSQSDLELLELMALALGRFIERDLQDREREQTRIQLNDTIALFESAFDSSAVGMALITTDSRFLKVNPALCEMLDYSAAELLSMRAQTLGHPEDATLDQDLRQELISGARPSYRVEKRFLRKDGTAIWGLLTLAILRNADGLPRYIVSQIQDINDRKMAEAQLAEHRRRLEVANRGLTKLVSIDPLTGVANRRALTLELDKVVAEAAGRPVSLLMLDVDHFKRYNDAYGHPAGDAALKAVAQCLRDTVRSGDFVARYGGEEFVILLPDTDRDTAAALAERLRMAVANVRAGHSPMSASIGVTTCTPQGGLAGQDVGRLVAAADEALYEAKALGRNRIARR